MKPCKECDELTSNKKYCSRECQYNSYRGENRADRIKRTCNLCEKSFTIKKSDIKYGRGKYCSRQCQDRHKKKTYKGENNPMYGRKMSKKQKDVIAESAKQMWVERRKEIIDKIRKAKEKFKRKNGCYPGWTNEARRKRTETFIKKYGKKHNLIGDYGKRKCDKVTEKKYGKPSHIIWLESGIKAQSNRDTKIEIKIESILQKNDIEYKKQIWIEDFRPDFWLPDHNLILEADGDYWHGNPERYEELDEIQKKTKKKDERKNRYFEQSEYNFERFWGSEIRSEGFETELIKTINSYE